MARHFQPFELNCPCCGMAVTPELETFLDALRDELRRPLQINSAARCPDKNKLVGGSAGSKHLLGIAADVRFVTTRAAFELVRTGIQLGARGVGVGKSFIHLDLRPENETALWIYS